jgi:FkbM family methyltransferase
MNSKERIINYEDFELKISDLDGSETLIHLEREVLNGDEYGFKTMKFDDGDVIVDIGANVGLVSVVLGKKFPNTKIYSFEPHPINFSNLVNNLKENGVTNVNPHNLAIYSTDNEILKMTFNTINTGSSSCFKNDENSEEVKTISLDTIIKENNITKIKFLKIDCEGAEFDALQNSKLIHEIEIENIGIEIHRFMEKEGKNVEELVKLVNSISKNNPKIKIYNG